MTHRQRYNFYVASCDAKGGIFRCEYSDGTARILEKTDLDRPMYMISDSGRMYVILRECFDDGTSGVVSFDIADGRLINKSEPLSAKGTAACHLCAHDGNIYCVNYLSGSVVKLPDKVDVHKGSGVNPARQEMPHTHYINSFDGKYLLCTDLGTDEIYTYDQNLNVISTARVPDGHGPRHLDYKDGYVYCANELKSTVSVFAYADGVLSYKNTVSALPSGTDAESTIAAIRIKDGYAYVSNRGHDSISVLKIAGDTPELITTVSCGGKSPRDFNIFDDLLVCTNENSDNVTFFEIKDAIPVKLECEFEIKAPLCVI